MPAIETKTQNSVEHRLTFSSTEVARLLKDAALRHINDKVAQGVADVVLESDDGVNVRVYIQATGAAFVEVTHDRTAKALPPVTHPRGLDDLVVNR